MALYLESEDPSDEGYKALPEEFAGKAVDAEVDGAVEEDAELDEEEEDLHFASGVVMKPSHLNKS